MTNPSRPIAPHWLPATNLENPNHTEAATITADVALTAACCTR